MALFGGWLREPDTGRIRRAQSHAVHLVASAGTGLDSAPIVSPDGRRIAFTAVSGGSTSTPVRAIARLARGHGRRRAPEGAKQPFWSPDGTSLGFFASGKLMRVAVAGGVPVVLCDAPDGRGGAWSPSGTIVFSPNLIFEGLAKVSADGGPVEPATLLDSTAVRIRIDGPSSCRTASIFSFT